jgi:hypothetical protein
MVFPNYGEAQGRMEMIEWRGFAGEKEVKEWVEKRYFPLP